MKIETARPHTIAPFKKAEEKQGVRAPGEAQHPTKADDAAFSVSLSKALEQSPAPAADEEELRRAKVAAIRDQLAAGSYNISGKDVANKILTVIKG